MPQLHEILTELTAEDGVFLDIRYATANNFVGVPLYPHARCYVHPQTKEALMCALELLKPKSLTVKIFDAYRPPSVQQKMWDLIQDERFVSKPSCGRHTRGTALDLALVDSLGVELPMPTPFDDFSSKAHANYPDLSSEQLAHRALLKDVMESSGFVQLLTEWWHFDLVGWETFDEVTFS